LALPGEVSILWAADNNLIKRFEGLMNVLDIFTHGFYCV